MMTSLPDFVRTHVPLAVLRPFLPTKLLKAKASILPSLRNVSGASISSNRRATTASGRASLFAALGGLEYTVDIRDMRRWECVGKISC
jgi:hypothetical protein